MSDDTKTAFKKRKTGPRRRAARLFAVQALYEIEVSGAMVDAVLAEFRNNRWKEAEREGGAANALAKPSPALFAELVHGVAEHNSELDEVINPALAGDSCAARMEPLLKVILRAAVHELMNPDRDVSAAIIISEYVDITHAFFSGNETSLVNGVLGALARRLRPDEPLNAKEAKGGGNREKL